MTQSLTLGVVPNGTGLLWRTGFNDAVQAISTQNEGSVEPSPTYPFMYWRNNAAKLLRRRNSTNTGWEILENYGAVTPPTANDDLGDGYIRGSRWIDISGSQLYELRDPTTSAARWVNISVSSVASIFGRTGDVAATAGDYTADKITDAATKVIMTVAERNRLKMFVTPQEFGAAGNGITNDSDAFVSAAIYCTANNVALFIPAGKYILKQQIGFLNSSAGIFGSGVNMTELRWAADSVSWGLLLSANHSKQSHLVRDLTLSYAKSGVDGSAIAITLDYRGEMTDIGPPFGLMTGDRCSPRCYLENIFIAGSDVIDSGDPTTKGWGTGILSYAGLEITACNVCIVGRAASANVADSNCYGLTFQGSTGGTSSNGHPVQFFVSNCTIWFCEIGVVFDNSEGCYVTNNNMVCCNIGIYIASVLGLPQLNVSNTHINCSKVGIWVNHQYQVTISGCLIYCIQTPTQDFIGVHMVNAQYFQIVHNTFASYNELSYLGSHVIVDGSSYGAISNNVFVPGGNAVNGIWLTGSASGCRGASNVYGTGFSNNVIDQGSGNSVS